MKKQIIIDYEEYFELIDKFEKLRDLIRDICFEENISDELKKEIERMNYLYGWWL